MTEKLLELLWRWIVLVEKRLAQRIDRSDEDIAREVALAELRGAFIALGFAVPTVDELREQWAAAEARGRARVTGDPPQTELVLPEDK